MKSSPCSPQLEKARAQQRRRNAGKNKLKKKKKTQVNHIPKGIGHLQKTLLFYIRPNNLFLQVSAPLSRATGCGQESCTVFCTPSQRKWSWARQCPSPTGHILHPFGSLIVLGMGDLPPSPIPRQPRMGSSDESLDYPGFEECQRLIHSFRSRGKITATVAGLSSPFLGGAPRGLHASQGNQRAWSVSKVQWPDLLCHILVFPAPRALLTWGA